MLSKEDRCQIGDLKGWVVDLEQPGPEGKKLIRSILAGSSSNVHQDILDQRSQEHEMIVRWTASISYSFFNGWTWRSLEKGDGIESENGRGPVNVPMIGHGSEGMTDSTTIGTEIETEKGTERGNECGRERERERDRDRGHGRDKERERGRDNDREHDSRPERDQVHERGYDQAGYERDHGYSHDKEAGYGSESKHGRGSWIKSSS
ncbi:unnamed protein product [Musa acuminata var. zebrina]